MSPRKLLASHKYFNGVRQSIACLGGKDGCVFLSVNGDAFSAEPKSAQHAVYYIFKPVECKRGNFPHGRRDRTRVQAVARLVVCVKSAYRNKRYGSVLIHIAARRRESKRVSYLRFAVLGLDDGSARTLISAAVKRNGRRAALRNADLLVKIKQITKPSARYGVRRSGSPVRADESNRRNFRRGLVGEIALQPSDKRPGGTAAPVGYIVSYRRRAFGHLIVCYTKPVSTAVNLHCLLGKTDLFPCCIVKKQF